MAQPGGESGAAEGLNHAAALDPVPELWIEVLKHVAQADKRVEDSGIIFRSTEILSVSSSRQPRIVAVYQSVFPAELPSSVQHVRGQQLSL